MRPGGNDIPELENGCFGQATAHVQVFSCGDEGLSTRWDGRRPRSAKARNRGEVGAGGATVSIGI